MNDPGGRVPGADGGQELHLRIANPWFYPVLVGPGERFRRYAIPLQARGIRTSVSTVRWEGLAEVESIDGIEIQRYSVDTGSRRKVQSFVDQLGVEWEGGAARPDVLQMFAYSPWSYRFIRKARRLGIPTVLIFTLLGKDTGPSWKRHLRARLRRRLFSVYDCIVTSSSVMTGRLNALGVSGPRLETIPNGVDLRRFRPPASEEEKRDLQERLGLEAGRLQVLFVGGMVPRKGIHILLDAWSRILPEVGNADLVLVGPRPTDGPEYAEYQRRLDRAVSDMSRPESVRFVGPVDNVEEYLRAADIFVFPSEREGMPNVVPEAMATGLACLVAPFDGLPEEFGEPGRDYLLTEREAPAMAGLLLALIKEPHRRVELGGNGRDWVERNLDLASSIDRYAQLYRSLASD